METLDDILRFSAFGLYVWLTALVLRDIRDRLVSWLAALGALAAAAYLLTSRSELMLGGQPLDLLLLPLVASSPVFAWLFCLTQFDDNFTIKPLHIAVGSLKMLTGAAGYISWRLGYELGLAIFSIVVPVIVLGIIGHLVYVVWRGRNDDLIEARRDFRTTFVWFIIIISTGVTIAEAFLRGAGIKQELLLLQASAFLVLAVYLLWRISGVSSEGLFFGASQQRTLAMNEIHCDLSPADRHDLDVLKGLVGTPQMLESGLTISKLSDQLHIPEHRLRHLINQHLGYRNFSDFLNHHRIERAKEQLSDQSNRNTPVLTVAMELGYGSLGPFNRAFKERTGLTPTEFRTQSLEASLAAAK